VESPDELFRVVSAAFPSSLQSKIELLVNIIPAAEHRPHESLDAVVGDERVAIPGDACTTLYLTATRQPPSKRQALMLRAFYTRHHDGHVREQSVQGIVKVCEPWVAPFVVCLVGEYVVEIVQIIDTALTDLTVEGSRQQRIYGRFGASNPDLIERTASRVASYWNEYYRAESATLSDYLPRRLFKRLEQAGRLFLTSPAS
jgi:hypothetical protein